MAKNKQLILKQRVIMMWKMKQNKKQNQIQKLKVCVMVTVSEKLSH